MTYGYLGFRVLCIMTSNHILRLINIFGLVRAREGREQADETASPYGGHPVCTVCEYLNTDRKYDLQYLCQLRRH